MKTKSWRLSLLVVLALGIVAGLGFAVTAALAADEPVKNASLSVYEGRGCWYIVRRGDTLFSIGMRYGVSPHYLAHLNGLWNPNIIYAGMKLYVPCGGQPPRPPKPPQPCAEPIKYLVRPGDNLFRIALNHGTTVEALRDANDLWGRVLRPGRTLEIACPTPKNGEPKPPDYGTPLPPQDRVAPRARTPATLPPVDNGSAPEMTPATLPTQDSGTTPEMTPAALPTEESGATPETTPAALPTEESGATPETTPAALPTEESGATPETTPAALPTEESGATPETTPAALPPDPSAEVSLGASAIEPNVVNIAAGESVVWINDTGGIATIMSGMPGLTDGQINSGEMPPGATFIYTFTAAGTYSYFVSENPTLTGQVIVTTETP